MNAADPEFERCDRHAGLGHIASSATWHAILGAIAELAVQPVDPVVEQLVLALLQPISLRWRNAAISAVSAQQDAKLIPRQGPADIPLLGRTSARAKQRVLNRRYCSGRTPLRHTATTFGAVSRAFTGCEQALRWDVDRIPATAFALPHGISEINFIRALDRLEPTELLASQIRASESSVILSIHERG